MAVDRMTDFTTFARRNVLTFVLTIAGVMGVGWWLHGIQTKITNIEHTQQTVEKTILTHSNCVEHPRGQLCLEGVRHGIARCLEDLRCSSMLASAPVVSAELREAAQHALEAHEQTSTGPKTTHEGVHHAHAPPVVGGGNGGGGHHPGGGGNNEPNPQSPSVPEPTAPASPPAAVLPEITVPATPVTPPVTATPSAPKTEVDLCVQNPLLPVCIHAGLPTR